MVSVLTVIGRAGQERRRWRTPYGGVPPPGASPRRMHPAAMVDIDRDHPMARRVHCVALGTLLDGRRGRPAGTMDLAHISSRQLPKPWQQSVRRTASSVPAMPPIG